MKTYTIIVNDKEYKVDIEQYSAYNAKVKIDNDEFSIKIKEPDKRLKIPRIVRKPIIPSSIPQPRRTETPGRDLSKGLVTAPIPGKILQLFVKLGDEVRTGQTLLIMEAMKMENEISAPINGVIKEIYVNMESDVLEGDKLLLID
ncbi:MAG: hypothetical protein DRH57_08780 [Candidatus Cloacimonadota bacterium]|nr:MAG: hypothetical protein DRH57_08780 [Candidatus Cloacimonadota bacterium]